MKVLLIGGTGTISMAITKQLSSKEGYEVFLLNRGSRTSELPSGIKLINADITQQWTSHKQPSMSHIIFHGFFYYFFSIDFPLRNRYAFGV